MHWLHRLAPLTLLAAVVLMFGAAQAVAARTTTPQAARPVADAAEPLAGQGLAAMQQQLQSTLDAAQRQQSELVLLRLRLAGAESLNAWLPWLVLGLALLCALVVWLALRVRRLQDEQSRRSRLRAAVSQDLAEPGNAGAFAASPLQPLDIDRLMADVASPAGPATDTSGMTVAHAHAPAKPPGPPPLREPATRREQSPGAGVASRPVSVEELLDLEQQVEFFLVLGQEQSAIDLLLSHVRGTGGTSALPYFKLLEIYRQQGDEEAYERTRERFNQRFNAFAPDWAGDLAGGRQLEHYPDAIARLQRAWPQPMRAVAEIESMLLRRADLEPFDLPAYRELLMLHALVLDLPVSPMAGPAPASAPVASAPAAALPPPAPARSRVDVDLLLPLGEGPLEITSPRPHVAGYSNAQAMLSDWVFTRAVPPQGSAQDLARDSGFGDDEGDGDDDYRPGMLDLDLNVDIDLSEPVPGPREFTTPAAFTDIDLRRDSRLSDLAFDARDSDSPALPSRH